MKKIASSICLLILLFAFLPSLQAEPAWRTNKLRQRAQVEEFEKKLDQIPIHREKLQGTYDILGYVHGEDFFSKKKDAIIKQMRIMAYKMGADAIMEFKCKRSDRSLYQQCEGFAIRFK